MTPEHQQLIQSVLDADAKLNEQKLIDAIEAWKYLAILRESAPTLARLCQQQGEEIAKLRAVAERMAESLGSAGTTDTDTRNWVREALSTLSDYRALSSTSVGAQSTTQKSEQ